MASMPEPLPDDASSVRAGRLTDAVPVAGEDFHPLVVLGTARVEHIVSSGTPDPGEQVQAWDEWVLVLAGAGELDLSGRQVLLAAGDWILIPAGTAHRVVGAEPGTQWIAVHGPAPGAAGPRAGIPGPSGAQDGERDGPG